MHNDGRKEVLNNSVAKMITILNCFRTWRYIYSACTVKK